MCDAGSHFDTNSLTDACDGRPASAVADRLAAPIWATAVNTREAPPVLVLGNVISQFPDSQLVHTSMPAAFLRPDTPPQNHIPAYNKRGQQEHTSNCLTSCAARIRLLCVAGVGSASGTHSRWHAVTKHLHREKTSSKTAKKNKKKNRKNDGDINQIILIFWSCQCQLHNFNNYRQLVRIHFCWIQPPFQRR